MVRVDDSAMKLVSIGPQGQPAASLVPFGRAPDEGLVDLGHRAFLEELRESAVRIGRASVDEDAARVLVEPVDDEKVAPFLSEHGLGDGQVGIIAVGYGEYAGALVDDEDGRVRIEDRE
jgi:hypothetical protein